MSAAELRKAAIVLWSLPEDQANSMLARLARDELEAVIGALSRDEDLTCQEQASVILEFTERIAARAARERAA